MAQNFLFMFEFVVDEVIVVKANKCAPEEYPTCCEVTFRNGVFVSICDHEFGQCIDPCKPKCGKSCLFSLQNPISDNDKLHIHVYKKKTDLCKFLLGFTSMPIKSMFDKVMENFNVQNPNWEDVVDRHIKSLPNSEERTRTKEIVDSDCDSNDEDRREELCPSSELRKQLLPIFNKKRCLTGNVVLLTRLVAIGPAIVSTFRFSRICNVGCEDSSPNCNSKYSRFEAGMDNMLGTNSDSNPSGSKQLRSNNGCSPLKDPCHKEVKKTVCQRYFACNADKSNPFDVIEDECERATKCKEQKRKQGCCSPPEPSNSCTCEEYIEECEAAYQNTYDSLNCNPCSTETCGNSAKDNFSPSGLCIQPCFLTPRQADPGPEAYDEFEACLNGSGLVIRVLKDSHRVENICDGTEDFDDANLNECDKLNEKENIRNSNCNFSNILRRSNFARNYIKRQTGGHIINHPNLPKIRANIKYSGNDNCCAEKYHVPYLKIKTHCDNQSKKIDSYRSHRIKSNLNKCDAICEPKHRRDAKSSCVQVDQQDIKNFMDDLDVDTRKKGIEVCYKTCEETDSDVFLVKLGSKQKSEYKKNNIEIELKTPKMPVIMAKQHVTTETQITEKDLDAALADVCNAKKVKSKKKNK